MKQPFVVFRCRGRILGFVLLLTSHATGSLGTVYFQGFSVQ